MDRLKAFLGLAVFLTVVGPSAAQLLTRPETVGGRILIFPDHKNRNVYHYVPTGLDLAKSFGRPQFFFYKYVYVKQDAAGGATTTAGGVLALTVQFKDEAEALRILKGSSFEYRPVPFSAVNFILSYTMIEPEGQKAKTEDLAAKKIPWTNKSFTLPLARDSASFLWKIFEEKKATGLSVECEFSFSGYELDDEGKLLDGQRDGRLSFAVPVSMEADADLFKVVNLADKMSFNFRRMSVLCFDFVNGTNGNVVKVTIEVEIVTAKKQRDSRTVSFAAGSDPQADLEFNIPEAKGGSYRVRVTKVHADGRSEKSEWKSGSDAFLDLSTYEIAIKDKTDGKGSMRSAV